MSEQYDRFQILALSGGGYRGLYTATVLEDLEKHSNGRIGDHFDLITGSSIGAIIALALALDMPAEKIRKTLEKHGPSIFPAPSRLANYSIARKFSGLNFFHGLLGAKHSNTSLREALKVLFKNKKIKDLKHRVLIPAVNYTSGLPQFFKTSHNPRFTRDANLLLVDVALATTAAPVFLPNYKLDGKIYVDGGLVGNAPGLFALHEAEYNIPDAEGKDYQLLAIGTLSSKITADQNKSVDRGLLRWGEDLFSLMISSQEGVSDFMLKQKLGENYYKIDKELSPKQDQTIGLDVTTKGATETLIGLGKASAQEASGLPFVQQLLNYQAQPPIL